MKKLNTTQDFNWNKLRFFKRGFSKKFESLEGLPPKSLRYRAFELTPFNEVKVVVLGQDPYHTKGYADGLCFSVQPHVKPIPPSLRNVLTEYSKDLRYPRPHTGDLSKWAREGVLLLNTIFTCPEGKPLGHERNGWGQLTYEALSELSNRRSSIVWMLWGNKAQEYRAVIDESRHLVLSAGHPSPTARNCKVPFLGCKHFSKANNYLVSKDIKPVDWKLY